jgi:hypothetical protein
MHAVKLDALDDLPKVARCGDGDDAFAQLTCANVPAVGERPALPRRRNRRDLLVTTRKLL